MGIGGTDKRTISGLEVIRGGDVQSKIALFNSSYSTLISVEESTKEWEEQQKDDLFSWVSTSTKSVRFDDEDTIYNFPQHAPSDRKNLWYNARDYEAFEDDALDEAATIRINLPKVVKRGLELYKLCSKAGDEDNTFRRRHRKRLQYMYRDVEDIVGLERLLLEQEKSYERNHAILSLFNEFGSNGGPNHDEDVCALASSTLSLPSRRRARELAVARAASVFTEKQVLTI